jgi:hypothetical protein
VTDSDLGNVGVQREIRSYEPMGGDLPRTYAVLEAVVQLSDAFSKVAYGPQGGVSVDSMHYVYDADYHDTKHEGEKRERPSGFAPPHA